MPYLLKARSQLIILRTMIRKEIEKLSAVTGKDAITTFNEFIDYCLCVFGVPLTGWSYSEGISKEFRDSFRSLIGVYDRDINEKGWCDPLGDTFMGLTRGMQSFRAQFFTPNGICDLMTDLTVDPDKKQPRKRLCGVYGYRTIISDPTAGSARNLLAAKARYAKRPEKDQPYFIGEDIDALCCKMSAINMCVHGCYGEVICHDTLTEPDGIRFGYLINVGLRYRQLPSIHYSDNKMMFETGVMMRERETIKK